MAQLKDLIVNGASRLIGDVFTNKIQITAVNAPTASNGTTYGPGTSGQILKSNGTNVYWAADNNAGGTVTSITLKAGNGISLDTDNTAITTSGTRTISHADTSSQASVTANGRKYITGVTLDTYGHVTGLTTGTETVTNTDTKVTQTVKTNNAEYAILTKDSTAVTTTTASSNFASNITINPSTNTISTTGFIKTTKGTYSYSTGSENVSGFFKFATLTISDAYVHCGIQISYTSCSRTGGTIYLICSNVSSSDPALTITKTGSANIYYIKSATSTWDLYINKTENYDISVFNIINPGQLQRGKMTLTWSNTSVTTLPAGYETAAIHTIKANIIGNADTATTATNATNIYSSASTTKAYVLGTTTASSANHATVYNASVYTSGSVLFGAAWNDYAEYRITKDKIEAGRCVVETGHDDLILSSKRLQPGAEIVSDTFGFAIGETEDAKTPIATTGRALAYIFEGRAAAQAAIGRPVCSGPNGTVSIMTDEEYQKYGYCAIGTISAVPDYEEWGEDDIKVNGRVWIRIR